LSKLKGYRKNLAKNKLERIGISITFKKFFLKSFLTWKRARIMKIWMNFWKESRPIGKEEKIAENFGSH
jgi:hypothetical protein